MGADRRKARYEQRLAFEVDREFGKLIRLLIKDKLRIARVPLEVEDIYYPFLGSLPEIIRDYDKEKSSLNTYILNRSRYFTRNFLREYEQKQYEILNKSISYDSLVDEGFEYGEEDESFLYENENEPEFKFDWSSLTEIEIEICRQHFIDGVSIHQISLLLGISRYKVNKIIEDIRQKLSKQKPL